MDALVGLLDGPRARGAFLLRCVLDPPWSVRIQDEAPLSLVAVVRGEAWIAFDGDEAVVLRSGDVAVLRGPDPCTTACPLGTAPQVLIHPGQRCTTPDGRSVSAEMDLGVRTWGTNPDGATLMLTGTYQLHGEVSRRLLDVLPPLLIVPADGWDATVLTLLQHEIGKDEPGQEVVLDRLLDLLLISVLRAWFARPGAPAWYRAHQDPVVGRALKLLHQHPERPWTVASLAAETGASRAAFARRFSDLVGEAPMAYLTGWRLALAADLLREPHATVGAVAHQVGYGSAFALSAAFKRVRGVSPRAHRTQAHLDRSGLLSSAQS